MNPDFSAMSHMDFLELHLSNARVRLAQAKTEQRQLLQVFVNQAQKELDTYKGYTEEDPSDEELLQALMA